MYVVSGSPAANNLLYPNIVDKQTGVETRKPFNPCAALHLYMTCQLSKRRSSFCLARSGPMPLLDPSYTFGPRGILKIVAVY